MTPLSVTQQAVLDYLRSYFEAHRAMPTYQEICDHMGWINPSPAKDCLSILAAKGYLRIAERIPYKRGWRVIYALKDAA